MKNIKYILAGAFFIFSLLVLIVSVLFSFKIINLDTFKNRESDSDEDIDVSADDSDSEVGEESEIPWIEYDYDYVSFSAPEDWELYDELPAESDGPITDIRLKKGEYIIRFHGIFGTTGGGYGNPFDGLCSDGRFMTFEQINEMFDRLDDQVVYSESVSDPTCSFLDTIDEEDIIWIGSYAVLHSENHESMEFQIIKYRDVFGSSEYPDYSSLYTIALMHEDFIAMPNSSSVSVDDAELLRMQAEFDDIVKTVVLKEV